MTTHEAAFEIGAGSLLVRDREGRFSFVHRSVMEWLLARDAAAAIAAGQMPSSLEQNELSPLMADFVLGLAQTVTEKESGDLRSAVSAGSETRAEPSLSETRAECSPAKPG